MTLHVLHAKDWDAPPLLHEVADVEAIIAVLDATASPSEHVEQLQRWGSLASERGVETLLCVVNKAELVIGQIPGSDDGSSATGSAGPGATIGDAVTDVEPLPGLEAIRDTCLDHGFELLSVSAHHPLVGRARREKEGLPRVYEALQNTLWSNMIRSQQLQPHGNAATRDTASAEAIFASELPNTETSNTEQPAPHGDTIGEDSIRQQAVDNILGDAAAEVEDSADDLVIERLMRDMQRVREAAATGSLSDDARRAAAARMVEQMMALMGHDDNSETEETIQDLEAQSDASHSTE